MMILYYTNSSINKKQKNKKDSAIIINFCCNDFTNDNVFKKFECFCR